MDIQKFSKMEELIDLFNSAVQEMTSDEMKQYSKKYQLDTCKLSHLDHDIYESEVEEDPKLKKRPPSLFDHYQKNTQKTASIQGLKNKKNLFKDIQCIIYQKNLEFNVNSSLNIYILYCNYLNDYNKYFYLQSIFYIKSFQIKVLLGPKNNYNKRISSDTFQLVWNELRNN
ncbi:hypothetical protein pb186bvf_020320 [Paramecium bursaria]